MGWIKSGKEAFAVLFTFDRSHWFSTFPEGSDLYTNHDNLICLSDSVALMPDIAQAVTRKVLRWVVRIFVYIYTCVHIRGEESVQKNKIWVYLLPADLIFGSDLQTGINGRTPVISRMLNPCCVENTGQILHDHKIEYRTASLGISATLSE